MDYRKLRRIPAVKAVMTPFPWSIHIENRLEHAREVMSEHEIRHLPVTENGVLVGVVTEREVGLLTSRSLDEERRDALRVRDACTLDVYVVDLSARLDRVLLEMAERRIGSALVVKNGKPVGILTAMDACRCFGEFLRSAFPESGGDEAA
jgi:acetoin utilization protein AcuB